MAQDVAAGSPGAVTPISEEHLTSRTLVHPTESAEPVDVSTLQMQTHDPQSDRADGKASIESINQCRDLADSALRAMEDIKPWEENMPADLSDRLKKLADLAEELKVSLASDYIRASRKRRKEGKDRDERDSSDGESNASSSNSTSVISSDSEGHFEMIPPPELPCEVQRFSMADWTPLPSGYAAIRAYYHRLSGPASSAISAGDLSSSSPPENTQAQLQGLNRNLQLISIHSPVLRAEFERFVSFESFPLLIGPPFKVIVRYLPELRQRLLDLEAEMETELHDAKADIKSLETSQTEAVIAQTEAVITPEQDRLQVPNDNGGNAERCEDLAMGLTDTVRTEAQEDLQTERSKRLSRTISHVKILLEFVDEEMRDIITLRAQIADGTLENIYFEDLWHLFQPGDLVISTRGPNIQLFKVCAVTGGQVQRRNYTKEESDHLNRLRQQLGFRARKNVTELHELQREEASGIGTWTPFSIDCYAMAFDGTEVGPLDFCKRIRHYSGPRAIVALDVFPLRFHPDSNTILQRMEERGRKVLASYGHKRYDGKIYNLVGQNEIIGEIRSDVFVDMKTFYRSKPIAPASSGMPPPPPSLQQSPPRPLLGHLLRSTPNPTETSVLVGKRIWYLSGHEVDAKLSENFMASFQPQPVKPSDIDQSPYHLQLMRFSIIGFAFRHRRWVCLDIDSVEDIDLERESRNSGFHELVMPRRYRELLVALVDNHLANGQAKSGRDGDISIESLESQVDLVQGKGQGVIILLHGPPGSGKTSTAETIAAYTQRPLYSLTCGDIGITPKEAEKNLIDHTKRAAQWGCVLLLDEADVFLMQRDWHKMDRNALVSVFLRELEYYSGILFLTTNRPGVLDEAFKSRIHVTLRYPSIDLESTKMMWTNIMNRLERNHEKTDIKIVFDRDELLDFAEGHYRRHERDGATWNGRQIRNSFRTALTLGHHERLQKLRDNGLTPEEAALSGKKKWMEVKLKTANFRKIAKTASEFEEYIVALRGKDNENMRDAELRDDRFELIVEGEVMQPARKNYNVAGGSRKNTAMMNSGKGKEPALRGGHAKPRKEKMVRDYSSDEAVDDRDDDENDRGSDEDEDDDEDED